MILGPSNIQQSASVAPSSVSQSQAGQQLSGKFGTTNFVATTSVTSLVNNSEELGMLVAGKKLKLNVKSKKATDEKPNQRKHTAENTVAHSIVNDASFAEEKASLVRLIKKFSKNEDLTEEDKDKMDELLDGMDKDTNAAADQFLVKAIEIIDKEGRRDEFAEKIDKLKLLLNNARKSNQKVDDQFWADLSDFSILPDVEKKISGEISRKYAESLGGMGKRLSDEYGTENHQAPAAVEIKKIGYEVGQATNNPERLLVLGKEMYILQIYCTFDEGCSESEIKTGRTCHYTIQEEGIIVRNNNEGKKV